MVRGEGETRERAIARLYEMLLRAARFEVARRRATLSHLAPVTTMTSPSRAPTTLVAVLGKLDDYRGESRFPTWVYKFALLEAAVKLRRRAWQGREVPLEPESWPLVSDGRPSPHHDVEGRELLRAIRAGTEERLTRHQREVFTALALNGVPIDVLAERLGTTRGALYKTLHDARTKLRAGWPNRGWRSRR